MHIGKEIRKRRKELEMTQEILAKRLNVTRATVGNWEQERNYPDSQLMSKIADVLDISLDALMNPVKDKEEKILKKEKNRKLGIKITAVCTVILIIIVCVMTYQNNKYVNVQSAEQFKKIELKKNIIDIELDLPWYRSVFGYGIGGNMKHRDIAEVEMYTQMDFQNTKNIEIDLNDWQDGRDIKTVKFMNGEEVIKTINIP